MLLLRAVARFLAFRAQSSAIVQLSVALRPVFRFRDSGTAPLFSWGVSATAAAWPGSGPPWLSIRLSIRLRLLQWRNRSVGRIITP